MPVPVSSSVGHASTRIVLSRTCQYPYRPQSDMPVPVSSSVGHASTRIVLSQKRPVPVSSSVGHASTRIVLSRTCQYPYRPQSDMPVPVSSSVKKASTCIVLSRTCQYPYRHTNTDTGVTDVRVMAFCQYGHSRIKDRTRIVLSRKCHTRTSRPVPAQACCAYGYLHTHNIHMYVYRIIWRKGAVTTLPNPTACCCRIHYCSSSNNDL